MKEPLYLVDGYSLIYRSYFAFIKRPLVNPQGENSSAVFGFFRSLFQLLKARSPAYLAVVMDSHTPTFRHQRYAEYKANREKAPEDLHDQVPVIEEILSALGVAHLRRDGYEADDVMATLAARCRKEGRPCFILSGDKDILQLVGEGVCVIQPPKGAEEFAVLDREEVFQSRGIYPEQVIDYLALTGDSSDNVPGVAGVGEKTALKLLAQYPSLEEIYRKIESVEPEGLRRKLAADRENAYLSRELVTLRADVPLEQEPESLRLAALNAQDAIPLFARQGMASLVRELGGEPEQEAAVRQITPGCYETVLDEKGLEAWIEEARRAGTFAFDTETDGLDPLRAHPVGFSLATAKGRACYIPVKAADVAPLALPVVLKRLEGLLADPQLTLVGQNIKFDYKVMASCGVRMRTRFFDTMVAAWLMDSERSSYGLDSLALNCLKYKTIHYEEVVGKDPQRTLADVEAAKATDYSGEDADIAYQLYQLFHPSLGELGLEKVFYELEMPLVAILSEMEITGIRLDTQELERYGRELERQLQELEKEIFALCGHPFNIRSTKELQVILFEELGLKPLKKTKTGQSTDNFVLIELARDGEKVPELVLDHRLLSKLKSTYVDTLPQLLNPETGRLHTNYIQTGAATGRLASKDPNLQNIPVREESGRRIRAAFVPEPGYLFMSADYAQIELVILAHLSGDPMLLEAFRQGKDIHRQTAALLFGIEEEQVSPEQRRIGKTINFGVIYGMSAFRLARDMRIGRREADSFIETYFQRYAGVDRFIRQTVRDAEKKGYVETLMGRRRPVPQVNSRNRTEKMAAERVAVNSPIQGSAADIVKKAMIDVTRALAARKIKARLLLQVHDELIFEVPEGEAKAAQPVIRKAMEAAVKLSAPLRVSVETSRTWGEIH